MPAPRATRRCLPADTKSQGSELISPSPEGEGLGWGLSPSAASRGTAPPPTPPLKGRGEKSPLQRFGVSPFRPRLCSAHSTQPRYPRGSAVSDTRRVPEPGREDRPGETMTIDTKANRAVQATLD